MTVSRRTRGWRLRLGQPLERGAGEIDEIGRHQRQHARRQKAHEPRKERGEDGDVGGHGALMRLHRRLRRKPPIPVSPGCDGAVIWSRKPTAASVARVKDRGIWRSAISSPTSTGILVGQRRRCTARLRRDRHRLRGACGRRGRRARRSARHAGNRPARAAPHGRAHRRRGAVRRLGLRLWTRARACRPCCANAAAASPSATSACRSSAAPSLFDLLNGGDKNWGRFPPYRDLGYAAAAKAASTSRSGPPAPASAPPRSTSRAGSARPPPSRATATRSARWSRSTPAAASMSAAARISGRRRSRSMASSAASAFRRRVPPAALHADRQRAAGREYDHRHRRDRRRPDQGADEGARRHRPGRPRPRHLPRAYHARWRYRVRGRDRPPAARRRRQRDHRARRGRRQRAGPRGRTRRIRGDSTAGRPPELAGLLRRKPPLAIP